MKSFISLLLFAIKITKIRPAKLPTDVEWQPNSKIVEFRQKLFLFYKQSIYTRNSKDTIEITAEMTKTDVVFL